MVDLQIEGSIDPRSRGRLQLFPTKTVSFKLIKSITNYNTCQYYLEFHRFKHYENQIVNGSTHSHFENEPNGVNIYSIFKCCVHFCYVQCARTKFLKTWIILDKPKEIEVITHSKQKSSLAKKTKFLKKFSKNFSFFFFKNSTKIIVFRKILNFQVKI